MFRILREDCCQYDYDCLWNDSIGMAAAICVPTGSTKAWGYGEDDITSEY